MKALLVFNCKKKNAKTFSDSISIFLEKKEISTKSVSFTEKNFQKPKKDEYDIIICLGGDGTILKVIHDYHYLNIPFFGINNGHFGFITPFTEHDWQDGLLSFINGECKLSNRIMLDIKQIRNNKIIMKDSVVNEVCIRRPESKSMLRIKASADGNCFANCIAADGVIVSTPTGSTAYSMSAGASILSPEMEAYIFTPSNPFMATNRAIVFPASCTLNLSISIRKESDRGIIDVDGKILSDMQIDDELEIKTSPLKYSLVIKEHQNEYLKIAETLYWNKKD